MELLSVRIEPSSPGRARLVGEVAYDGVRSGHDRYWYDVPEDCADLLSTSGNPWLAILLPLAMTRREPIHLAAPVDPVLLDNARRLMEIWTGWYPHLRPVEIHADTIGRLPPGPGRETAAMFSGGVDSFFTILRESEPDRSSCPKIDRLLAVWGFDIRLEKPEEFERHRAHLAAAAGALGKRLVVVATNMMNCRFREANWGRLSHGSALASVGLALENGLHTLFIAPTFGANPPWGSHPDTDPLHSTSRLRVVHDAPHVDRWSRTEFISRSPVAMHSLHVCPRDKTSRNCGRCRKCYLLKLTLEVLGALNGVPTFEEPGIDLDHVRRLYAERATYRDMLVVVRDRARVAGREDIAAAVDECLSRTSRRERWFALGERWSTTPVVWHAARAWRRALLRGFVQ